MHLTLRHPNRVLLGALALGICADYFFNGRSLGISVPLFVALFLALLIRLGAHEQQPAPRRNLWLGGLALCFALGIMLRATPLLVFLDLLVVIGFLFLFVGIYRGTALRQLSIARIWDNTARAIVTVGFEPAPLIAHGVRSMPRTRADRLLPLGRGLLLALPVLACFGGLLMSADSVFASYVLDMTNLPFNVSANLLRWLGHLLFVQVATYICAGALLAGLTKNDSTPPAHLTPSDLPAEGDTQRLPKPRRFLGFTEALTVLVAVDVLFGSFMAIQAAYLFGGIGTLDRTGMTYADYARRGFFELLLVTCLALGLIWTLAYFTQRVQVWKQRAFNGTSGVLILLMLGLLASAFERLLLYEDAYGYTRLRLYTHSFMIWLAVLLPIFLIALWRNRFRLFVSGSIVTALIYLALLNVVNTDALIVRENLRRYEAHGKRNDKLDVEYLKALSFDATPALVAGLDTLDIQARTTLDQHLLRQSRELLISGETDGWPSWHVGRSQALSALRQHYGDNLPSSQALPDGTDHANRPIGLVGPAIAQGTMPSVDPQGVLVSGLTPGAWYAIETSSGPWYPNNPYAVQAQYGAWVSNDDGRTWYGLDRFTLDDSNFLNAWGTAVETVDGKYQRGCWQATTTSIRIRVADTRFQDNAGTLAWSLFNARPCV